MRKSLAEWNRWVETVFPVPAQWQPSSKLVECVVLEFWSDKPEMFNRLVAIGVDEWDRPALTDLRSVRSGDNVDAFGCFMLISTGGFFAFHFRWQARLTKAHLASQSGRHEAYLKDRQDVHAWALQTEGVVGSMGEEDLSGVHV
jgi:hypothetical protein